MAKMSAVLGLKRAINQKRGIFVLTEKAVKEDCASDPKH